MSRRPAVQCRLRVDTAMTNVLACMRREIGDKHGAQTGLDIEAQAGFT